MSETVGFETPEHVAVTYDLAGLGTRFVAWVYDMLVILAGEMLLIIAMTLLALFEISRVPLSSADLAEPSPALFAGVAVILFGFLPTLYFLLFEQFMNGQTPGKRSVRIRVVMAEGFSLTFTSVFLRNVFRLVDTIPLLWSVPCLSTRVQRFGDMIAGTIVVQEHAVAERGIQAQLLRRASESKTFTFTPAYLNRLEDADFNALETFLNRRPALSTAESAPLTERMARAFTERMEYLPMPEPAQHALFLEDLLAAHLQRQVGGLK